MPQLQLLPRDTEGAKLLDRFEEVSGLSPFRFNERTGLRGYSFEKPVAEIDAKLDQVGPAGASTWKPRKYRDRAAVTG